MNVLINWIIFQLVITVAPTISANCRYPALKKCTCGEFKYERKLRYIVNCTDTGFTDTSMLTQLPEETQVLIFTGNHIPVLPWNIFGELQDLSDLRTIDMSNNGIKEIKGKSYHHVPNVERLILNHNDLTISDDGDENFHHPRVFSNFINLLELHLTNAFADNTDEALANDLHDIFVNSNLTKLIKLHLEQNEIKGFRDPYVFCDLPNLRDIYLGDNFIPSLNFNVTCLKKMRFIDLEHNNITKFTQGDLDTFDRMTYPHRDAELIIDIGSNPFKCDSAVKHLFPWLHKTNVTVRNKDLIKCHQIKNGMKYILNLKHLSENKHAKVSKAVTVLVIILSIILVTLLATLAYLSRENLRVRMSPFIEKVTRKVHYTTIESQDV